MVGLVGGGGWGAGVACGEFRKRKRMQLAQLVAHP